MTTQEKRLIRLAAEIADDRCPGGHAAKVCRHHNNDFNAWCIKFDRRQATLRIVTASFLVAASALAAGKAMAAAMPQQHVFSTSADGGAAALRVVDNILDLS